MRIRLEAAEIEQAVELWINKMYIATHDATIVITSVTGKNYADPTSYVIEADVTIPTGKPSPNQGKTSEPR